MAQLIFTPLYRLNRLMSLEKPKKLQKYMQKAALSGKS